jgi:hypothetical protein
MKYKPVRIVVFALLIGYALVGARPAMSAEDPNRQGINGAQAGVSEKELNAFVKVYVEYQRIRSSYGPALDRATEPQQKMRIEQDANAKIKQSLDANGLTSERYNKIFAAVNSNEQLRKRVLKKVEEQRQRS